MHEHIKDRNLQQANRKKKKKKHGTKFRETNKGTEKEAERQRKKWRCPDRHGGKEWGLLGRQLSADSCGRKYILIIVSLV